MTNKTIETWILLAIVLLAILLGTALLRSISLQPEQKKAISEKVTLRAGVTL